MVEITAALVKELRDKTGAGMMDCKRALQECGGSVEKAIEHLRKKGLKDINKREGKTAAEGFIGVYSHHGGQIAAIVELNCETDFVARGEEFQKLAHDLAMQVAAMNPRYCKIEDVPEEVLEKEKEIMFETLNEQQRKMADKILPGKLKKFYEETVLYEQPFVKDESGKKTVKDVINELAMKIGEKITVRRFVRMRVGEGIEKKSEDLAEAVAAAIAE
ncbi:MAG: translation elongation factor Ts [Candidatus Dadabacteria bacterium]|nr:MAG: translation elongation factor Ts [Candidatus Dadabacteria bacterium]